MQINSTNNFSFKGYDARPLKGFLMSENLRGIQDEMAAIGKKEGFKVFSILNKGGKSICKEGPSAFSWMMMNDPWAQDYWTFRKDSLLTNSSTSESEAIKSFFALSTINNGKNIIHESAKKHIAGGNLYIVKNGDKEDIFVGMDEINFDNTYNPNKLTIQEIKEIYDAERVIPIPQMDYHIDLFIRPLDNKRVLLADDEMSLKILEEMKNKISEHIKTIFPRDAGEFEYAFFQMKHFISARTEDFEGSNSRAMTSEIEKILTDSGYEVVRVPANISVLNEHGIVHNKKYRFNFINANVTKNSNDELVYITNKSNLEEILSLTPKVKEVIGGGVEDYFARAISEYVKPEHIYFVSGKDNVVAGYMLWSSYGGIHCACAEVP